MGQPDLEAEARALLADALKAPWVVVGSGPYAVMSEGSRNGTTPLVAICLRREDADLVAAGPALIQSLLAALATLRAIRRPS